MALRLGLRRAAVLGLAAACLCAAAPEYRRLDEAVYLDKAHGGWLGKISGLTLGIPREFGMPWPPHQVSYFYEVPTRFTDIASGDDVTMPLVFQLALKKYGIRPTHEQYMQEWLDRLYPGRMWGANLAALEHYRAGIKPPLTGASGIAWNDGLDLDAQIDLDPMGWVAPGMMNRAAAMARHAGQIMSHGEGLDGAIFVAALNSEAFFANDVESLVRRASLTLPAGSRYRAMVEDLLRWSREEPDWRMTRQRLKQKYDLGRPAKAYAVINGGAVVLGLLYGKGDFAQTVLITMKAGWDSDCNAATAGGVIGTLLGASKIPPAWGAVFQDRFENWCTRGLPRWFAISDLGRDSVEIGLKVLADAGAKVDGEPGSRVLLIPEEDPRAAHEYVPATPEQKTRNERLMLEHYRGRLAGIAESWSPGWSLTMAAFETQPAVLADYFGRTKVLRVQPNHRGATLERTVSLEAGKFHYLRVGGARHTGTLNHETGQNEVRGWRMEAFVNGEKVGEFTFAYQGIAIWWDDVEIDLSKFAGQIVQLKLVGKSASSYNEFHRTPFTTYWSHADIVTLAEREPWR